MHQRALDPTSDEHSGVAHSLTRTNMTLRKLPEERSKKDTILLGQRTSTSTSPSLRTTMMRKRATMGNGGSNGNRHGGGAFKASTTVGSMDDHPKSPTRGRVVVDRSKSTSFELLRSLTSTPSPKRSPPPSCNVPAAASTMAPTTPSLQRSTAMTTTGLALPLGNVQHHLPSSRNPVSRTKSGSFIIQRHVGRAVSDSFAMHARTAIGNFASSKLPELSTMQMTASALHKANSAIDECRSNTLIFDEEEQQLNQYAPNGDLAQLSNESESSLSKRPTNLCDPYRSGEEGNGRGRRPSFSKEKGGKSFGGSFSKKSMNSCSVASQMFIIVISFGLMGPLYLATRKSVPLSEASFFAERTDDNPPAMTTQMATGVHLVQRYAVAGYDSRAEMNARSQRFPSVEDRIKHYMSNWYLPPCDDTKDLVQYHFEPFQHQSGAPNTLLDQTPRLLLREVSAQFDNTLVPQDVVELMDFDDMGPYPFYLTKREDEECLHDYCMDVVKYLHPALDAAVGSIDLSPNNEHIPLILQYGDSENSKAIVASTRSDKQYPSIPIIKKFRHAIKKQDLDDMTSGTCVSGARSMADNYYHTPRLQPVVWLLTYKRHFGRLQEIAALDRPWQDKVPKAVYRGALTGRLGSGIRPKDLNILPEKDKCIEMHRCRLVYQTGSSDMIDARLVGPRKGMPDVIDGVPIFGEPLDFGSMLENKAIIMLEGNDISSGFKWALLSNSVVMTQEPKYTSWAMEELLEAWVHYIPLNRDLSDVEEKMTWVLHHDEEAQKIAHRGRLWMLDLVSHPQAEEEDQQIFQEMITRYRAHFVHEPELSLIMSPAAQQNQTQAKD